MDKYLLFFERIKLICEKYRNNSEIDNFNIFSSMFKEHDEVNLHSKFIFELLSNTNLSKEFLLLFLKILNLESLEENFIIMREYKNIDILLKSSNVAIIIENKIFADDQDKQLFRYNETLLKENYEQNNIYIIYLTLDGKEPSENSIQDLTNYQCISYKDDISEWLKMCMKESIFENSLREVINQYRKLILMLSGKINGGKSIMEIKDYIIKSPENIEITTNLVEALTEVKIELQYKFWKDLEKALKTKSIVFENLLGYHYSKEWVINYYKKSRNNKWYGLAYKIHDLKSGVSLYTHVEVDYYVYWGFLAVKDEEITNEFEEFNLLKEKYIEMLSETGIKFYDDPKTVWIGYMKFQNKLNFREFNHMDIFNLADDNLRQETIEKCVKDIMRSTEKFLEKIDTI